MALAAIEPKFFARFCELAGCPHLADKGMDTGVGNVEGATLSQNDLPVIISEIRI